MLRIGIVAASALAMLVALSGCVTTYTYGGAQYQSRVAAEQAQQTEIQTILAALKPYENKVPGRAIVMVPDYASFRQRGFTSAQNAGPYGEDQFDYVTQSALANIRSAYQTLERVQLFDSVELVETAEVERPSRSDYDHFLWFKLVDAQTAGWLYYTPTMVQPEPIPFDTTISRGVERANGWVARLAELASRNSSATSKSTPTPTRPAQPAVIRTLN